MKKDYILDDGKIRNCNSNIAKMNILEYIWFDITSKVFFKWATECLLETGKDMFINMFYFIINILLWILFPFTLLIRAIVGIKCAKKEVKAYENMKNNM